MKEKYLPPFMFTTMTIFFFFHLRKKLLSYLLKARERTFYVRRDAMPERGRKRLTNGFWLRDHLSSRKKALDFFPSVCRRFRFLLCSSKRNLKENEIKTAFFPQEECGGLRISIGRVVHFCAEKRPLAMALFHY